MSNILSSMSETLQRRKIDIILSLEWISMRSTEKRNIRMEKLSAGIVFVLQAAVISVAGNKEPVTAQDDPVTGDKSSWI